MYNILMLLTFITFVGSTAFICAISIDENKKHLWRLLLFIPIIWISFLFEKTGSFTNYKEVAKHLDKKWYVVYENNINADVTVTSGDMKLNPKKLITKGDTEKFFSSNDTLMDTLLGTNDATLTNDNFIEKWPKGVNHNKSKGRITKIEYRSTPITLKWFGIPVQKTSYNEARITVEYGATGDESTAQLFGED